MRMRLEFEMESGNNTTRRVVEIDDSSIGMVDPVRADKLFETLRSVVQMLQQEFGVRVPSGPTPSIQDAIKQVSTQGQPERPEPRYCATCICVQPCRIERSVGGWKWYCMACGRLVEEQFDEDQNGAKR